MKPEKSIEVRLNEIKEIYQKMYALGLSDAVCPGLKSFRTDANLFVKTGQSINGKIKLNEIDRELIYILSSQPHVISSATLKYANLDRRLLRV